jgi:hypothetical protein
VTLDEIEAYSDTSNTSETAVPASKEPKMKRLKPQATELAADDTNPRTITLTISNERYEVMDGQHRISEIARYMNECRRPKPTRSVTNGERRKTRRQFRQAD